MSSSRPLRVGVAELRRRPGTRRRVEASAALPGLGISTAAVPSDAPVEVDVVLESLSDGIVAEGTVAAPWIGECRRCLEPVEGRLEARVREVFEREPTEGESYAMGEDEIDLEPMVRDAVLLALPLAPLCRPDCAGPAPDSFPTGPEAREAAAARRRDERWAALDGLQFDEDER